MKNTNLTQSKMEDFKIEKNPTILYCLKHYYKKSGKDKETGKPIEDWLYKANELFRYQEDGHISAWHLDTIEDYFGVPAYNYLLDHQECYMDGCPIQRDKAAMRRYLRNSFHRNDGEVKFHVYDFRRMVGCMA